jgi:hypothetical protein
VPLTTPTPNGAVDADDFQRESNLKSHAIDKHLETKTYQFSEETQGRPSESDGHGTEPTKFDPKILLEGLTEVSKDYKLKKRFTNTYNSKFLPKSTLKAPATTKNFYKKPRKSQTMKNPIHYFSSSRVYDAKDSEIIDQRKTLILKDGVYGDSNPLDSGHVKKADIFSNTTENSLVKKKNSGYLGINGSLIGKPVYFCNEKMRAASISNLNAIAAKKYHKRSNSSFMSPLFSPKDSEALHHSINSSIYHKRNEIKDAMKNSATRVGHRSM